MTPSVDYVAQAMMIAPWALPLHSGPMGDRLRFVRNRGIDTGVEVERHGSVAVVRCEGLAVRRTSFWEGFEDGFSTESLAETVRQLGEDDDVDAIVLWADSPGGEAHGVDFAARVIRDVARVKPVIGQVQGGAHSAMYYLLCGCTRIVMHAEDRVGSIGVIATLVDLSEMYKTIGARRVTVTTGPLKGIGVEGDPITEEQEAHIRHHVDRLFKEFKAFVAEGRGLSSEAVDQVAHGGVFSASEAIGAGLVDGLATLEETIASLRVERKQSNPTRNGERAVSTNTDAPKAVTIDDLQACLPGVTDAFCVESLKKGWTLDQAQSAWMERQHAANQELQTKLTAAEKAAAESAPGLPDEEAIETTKPGAGSAAGGQEFAKKVESLIAAGVDRSDAVMQAAHENPEGHKAFVAAYQARVGAA